LSKTSLQTNFVAETAPISWWDSKLAQRLQLFATLAAILLLCRFAFEEDISWLFWILAGVVALALTLVRWPYGAFMVLIGASAMPRVAVGLSGWNARPEHFAAAIVASCVAVRMLYGKSGLRLEKLDYWILAYVLLNYLSSALGSSQPANTLRWALQNNLAVLSYFLIRLLVNDTKTLEKALRILLAVGLAEASFGLLCYVAHNLFGTTVGVELGVYLYTVAAPYGTLYEPNHFGAYCGCLAALFLALYLMEGHRRRAYLLGFLVASIATVSSFSRAAFFALLLAAGWIFWKTRHFRVKGPNRFAVLAVGAGLLLVILASATGGVLRERLTALYYQGLTEETALSRVLIIQQAIQEVPNHPIIGSGTGSFNLSFDWTDYIPEWASDKTWIGNAPLRIVHDTGLLGFTAICGFFVSLWLKIRRDFRGPNGPTPVLLALVGGSVVYAISFQSTDGTILAFFWVYLGFLASAAILAAESPQDSMLASSEAVS
jgi:O-antigen ligase